MHERRPIAARGTRWAERITRALLAIGATPNAISAASVGFAVGAGIVFAQIPSLEPVARIAAFLGAGVLIQGRLLCNLFDGMVAVEGKQSSVTGELWNDLPDRLSDTAILVGAGIAAGLPSLGWGAAVLALHVAYVRVLGRAVGGRTHFLGPMAKQHRMAALTVGCAIAAAGSLFHIDTHVIGGTLVGIAVGCGVTFVRRLQAVAADLHTGSSPRGRGAV